MPIEVTRKLIAVYWGYVALIDEQIGRVMDAHGATSGWSTTPPVFFTCDHGEFTGAHRLHDKGPAMYEDIYRTPGHASGSPARPAGEVRGEFVSLLDCTATILDLAGIDPHRPSTRRSLVPLVRGRAAGVGGRTSSASSTATTSPTRSGCSATTATSWSSTRTRRQRAVRPATPTRDELLNVYEHPEMAPVRAPDDAPALRRCCASAATTSTTG